MELWLTKSRAKSRAALDDGFEGEASIVPSTLFENLPKTLKHEQLTGVLNRRLKHLMVNPDWEPGPQL